MPRRVVVSGCGVISPLGLGKENNWDNLIRGKSGITKITQFDASKFTSQIAGEVKDFRPEDFFSSKEAKKTARFVQFAITAAKEAVEDSGIDFSKEDWDKVIAINLKGVFNCSKAVAKFMLKQRAGKIVNISSVIGIMGNAGQTNYGASKAGIIGFTKSLAKELGPRGICVNAVAPGYIQTAMTDKLPEEVKKKMLAMIPLGRFGKPEDIAAAVLFLASEASSYITGKVLTVDGGML